MTIWELIKTTFWETIGQLSLKEIIKDIIEKVISGSIVEAIKVALSLIANLIIELVRFILKVVFLIISHVLGLLFSAIKAIFTRYPYDTIFIIALAVWLFSEDHEVLSQQAKNLIVFGVLILVFLSFYWEMTLGRIAGNILTHWIIWRISIRIVIYSLILTFFKYILLYLTYLYNLISSFFIA